MRKDFNFKTTVIFLAVITALFSACQLREVGEGDDRWYDDKDKNIQVMFSSPGYDLASAQDAGVQDRIADLLRTATDTVDICIYELSDETIYSAVLEAYDRGVTVRFVGDIDNMNYEGYQAFMRKGIDMSIGNQTKIMHNKYIIVDDRYLVTGSMNFTTTGVYHNNENVLFIDSPELCAYYKKDFETMFINKLFGTDKIYHKFDGFDNNSFIVTNEDGTTSQVEAYVIPYIGYEGKEDGTRVDYRFMDYVNNAEKSIYFAIFAFTHPDIAYAVINAAKTKGVQVYGVFDKSWHSANEYSLHQVFIDAAAVCSNIHVVYDGNDNWMIGNTLHGSKCHNKYMVIDAGTSNAVVLTGSYNFSSAASYKGNDENFLAIHDEYIASMYEQNFFYMYSIGSHPTMGCNGDDAEYHDVKISEVMWAGSVDNLGNTSLEDKFIELRNDTDSDINIGGWQIVGTTAISKSYRITMSIFPEDTVIPAGGYHVLAYTTNKAFNCPNATVDYFLYLYHSYDQNYINLTLRDPDFTIIDEVGQPGQAPFAGTQASVFASMIRSGTDGTAASSWISCPVLNDYVVSDFRLSTKATPGTE